MPFSSTGVFRSDERIATVLLTVLALRSRPLPLVSHSHSPQQDDADDLKFSFGSYKKTKLSFDSISDPVSSVLETNACIPLCSITNVQLSRPVINPNS
ncbi:hypothetical protein ACH5RR_004333 [Cinchona calisaya]|uniref:Uncharacterized protein n=1 Tax=Cinchona calisaya TaxID=153742 RepID=A0ABD3AY62_9GENT